ncbi:hypothetical protein DXG01_005170 [Tephrocybe rancida]|nr:hypothetical protein DXG01_005170 [Tephrocybe rancida]
MFNLGAKKAQISRRIKFTDSTVTNVIDGVTGKDKDGDDWDHISPTVAKELRLLKLQMQMHGSNVDEVIDSDEEPLDSRAVKGELEEDSDLELLYQNTPEEEPEPGPSTWSSMKKEGNSHSLARPRPLPQPASRRRKAITAPLLQASASTRRRVSIADTVEDVEVGQSETRPLPTIKSFLKNLEHDLGTLAGELEAQGLGTTALLFALAPWSEDDLHKLFKELIPNVTGLQRFILVHGLKNHVSDTKVG